MYLFIVITLVRSAMPFSFNGAIALTLGVTLGVTLRDCSRAPQPTRQF